MSIIEPSLPEGFFTQSSLFQNSENESISSVDHLVDTTNPLANSKNAILFDGSTISLRPKKRKEAAELDQISVSTGESLNLIDIDGLYAKVELKRAIKSSNKIISSSASKRNGNGEGETAGLWTDKYRPKTFMEVCSAGNDKSYRLILHWLRKWSTLVFKEELPQNDNVDHLGRPLKKILLINGPVGMGKTTVAHLLATQLGYSVQELNAANSMDPSLGSTHGGSALKTKVVNALTSNSLTSNGKPTCLVIDEIDSAINSAEIIKVLTDLVHLDSRNRASAISANSKDKKKPFQLNRPIICIANDIYQSASSGTNSSFSSHYSIDKLRPHCEIITFRKPIATQRGGSGGNGLRTVKEFLMQINKWEKMGLNFRDINEIVEVCEGDIRSCINFLQFNSGGKVYDAVIEEEKSQNDTESYVSNSLKDTQLSWFAIVTLLFKRNQSLSKDENFGNLLNLFTNGGGKASTSANNVIDKVIKGCFNKYLDAVATQDDSAVKPAQLSDWLWFYDQMDHSGSGSSSTLLGNYSSAVYLKIWSMFSDINSARFSASNKTLVPSGIDFESFELSRSNKFAMKRIIDNFPVQLRISIGNGIESSNTIPGIFLPYLDKMMTPIHSTNHNSNQNIDHEKIAQIIKDFQFQLENHKDLDSGEIKLQFSPEFDTITNFNTELSPQPLATLTKLVQLKRKWLFPLLKLELDRLDSLRKRKHVTLASRNKSEEPENKADLKSKRSRLTNSADFFKARYDNLATQTSGSLENEKTTVNSNNSGTSHIWVKYHEGFSNAVRINVGWDDLWLPPHEYVE
ncbi:chromosome transmission fidelity protein 18 [[Candida] railenensis]|uniref:Chromosome transmission fidelity protein 18 n=1 Tax=[Candida] railenensis TaxID=45579 RepID=A0A9P0QJ18_9ASCO|nr:chromosome transmission fidelity protein 18 [[Candida] railenensis]